MFIKFYSVKLKSQNTYLNNKNAFESKLVNNKKGNKYQVYKIAVEYLKIRDKSMQ